MITGKLLFPGFMIRNIPSRPLIEQLLTRDNPSRRGTPKSIMQHNWFENYPWNDLRRKTITPSFKPKISNFSEKISEIENTSLGYVISRDELDDQIRSKNEVLEGWDDDF